MGHGGESAAALTQEPRRSNRLTFIDRGATLGGNWYFGAERSRRRVRNVRQGCKHSDGDRRLPRAACSGSSMQRAAGSSTSKSPHLTCGHDKPAMKRWRPVRRLPSEDQDDIARDYSRQAGRIRFTAPVVFRPKEREAIARSKAAA